MKSLLHHLFFPHSGNNHRSKLLHNSSLFALILFVLFSTSITLFVHKTHPEVLGVSYSISSTELLSLVNNERVSRGLGSLSINSELSVAASNKADHMFANDYWAHFAPDGTSPWYFIKASGYNYLYAGENLAKGFTNSGDTVNAWMNSPTHRDNILSPQFKDVGFAIKEGKLQGEDTVLVVEMFGARSNPAFASEPEQTSVAATNTVAAAIPTNTPIPTPTASPPVENKELLGAQGAKPIIVANGKIQSNSVISDPLIDANGMPRVIAFVILSLILLALFLDFIIVEKKRIPRIVGNNIDHIILILLFIVFIFISNIGSIL